MIAVRVLVVVVLRRVLCEVSAETLVSRCGTMCACARAPAQRTKTLFNLGENRGLRMWGVIPIHPPVETCYKFAFALVLHAVCVSHLTVRFKYAAAPKLPNLQPEFSTTVGSRPCFFMGSVDAPRRARGRGTATFS